MYRIFIVEDDEIIAKAIADRLNSWGFEASCCDDFKDVIPQLLDCDLSLIHILIFFVIVYECLGGLTEWLRSSPGKRVRCNSPAGSSPVSSAIRNR